MSQEGEQISHSVMDAVDRLGVSRRTVYYMIEDGRLRVVSKASRHQRITNESLVEMSRYLKSSVTVTETAERLGIGRRCAYRWMQKGRLIAIKDSQGHRRVTLQSIGKEINAQPRAEP